MIVDLFAGPGGWSEGLRMLEPDLHTLEVGFEWDAAASATRGAAGHRTIRTDIADWPLDQHIGKVWGVIASPPCQDFSTAGKRAGIDGERGQLITEVIRWVDTLQPEWFACEQVPPALPIWQEYAEHFRSTGYSTWCGVLNAADYGVPQTRRRAFLIGSRTRTIAPPEPTHAADPMPTLFGTEAQPWVTMADALGWGRTRANVADEIIRGEWVLNPGKTASQPARRLYELDEPAPTIAFGHDASNWCWERPATTIVSSFRPDIVAGPGVDLTRPRQDRAGSVRITPIDALVLQSFPADYPVQGAKTKQFEQIGNAVPPLLAAHVLAAVTGRRLTIADREGVR